MIVEKKYKRNENGEISKREIVEIICDKCGKTWESKYSSRKNKILECDLCKNCRNKRAWSKTANTKKGHNKIDVVCKNCLKAYKKTPSSIISKNIFCSHKCKNDYALTKRYGHLEKSFEQSKNEVAYLSGLILGDGHLNKRQKRTTNINISFDYTEKWRFLITEAKTILNNLQIKWTEDKNVRRNCKTINFILPDSILEKYMFLYFGDKFTAQPIPVKCITENINFASGLINADGQFVYFKNKNWSSSYRFSNTVKSIVQSLSLCLSYNKINHSVNEHKGRFDKRTGKTNKNYFVIYIGKEGTKLLEKISSFKLKGFVLSEKITMPTGKGDNYV
jgi:ssDNA-binding Zn-finger/Zn-ribbon topoisomerase 1